MKEAADTGERSEIDGTTRAGNAVVDDVVVGAAAVISVEAEVTSTGFVTGAITDVKLESTTAETGTTEDIEGMSTITGTVPIIGDDVPITEVGIGAGTVEVTSKTVAVEAQGAEALDVGLR